MVSGGIKLRCVPIDTPGQECIPHSVKKKQVVQQMLRQASSPYTPEQLFTAPQPLQVAFPNHKSAHTYSEFVSAEIVSMLGKGVIQEWTQPTPPTVINPIRVVDEKAPKLRFCINPMFINLFMPYRPLHYESLSDVRNMVLPDDMLLTTDDKHGYWHCPIHPSSWQLLGMQWEGKTYVWRVLPFGIAPACAIYSMLKREIFRPMRTQAGVWLVFLIDDQLTAAKGRLTAVWQAQAIARLLTSLGFFLSLPKCQLDPQPTAHFLGMVVDAPDQSPRSRVSKLWQLKPRPPQWSLTASSPR